MGVRATHRRPGSGQEGAAAASPPLPADLEVPLSSCSQRSRTLCVVPGTTNPLLCGPQRAGSPESISPTNV